MADIFRHLKTLEDGSAAFLRQREAIIQRGPPLADHIAQRYGGRGETHDDLVQAARVGLVKAVNRFDLTHGADFASFVVPTIMGEVRRHFRDHGWAVKVSPSHERPSGAIKQGARRAFPTAGPRTECH